MDAAAKARVSSIIKNLGVSDGGFAKFVAFFTRVDAAAVVGLVALDGRTRNGQLIALSGEDAAAVALGLIVADSGILNGERAALGFNASTSTFFGEGCFVACYGYAVQGNIGFLPTAQMPPPPLPRDSEEISSFELYQMREVEPFASLPLMVLSVTVRVLS